MLKNDLALGPVSSLVNSCTATPKNGCLYAVSQWVMLSREEWPFFHPIPAAKSEVLDWLF